MNRRTILVTVGAISVSMLLLSCISRYRLDLYMTVGDEAQRKIKVEKTEYVKGAVIRDPMAVEKLAIGDGNCVILHTGARGDRIETDRSETLMIDYDEYVRCLLYFELPGTLRVETLSLEGRSFVKILGRYQQSMENTTFQAVSGTLAIDSIAGRKLYCSIDGTYHNGAKEQLLFSGRLKVKIED